MRKNRVHTTVYTIECYDHDPLHRHFRMPLNRAKTKAIFKIILQCTWNNRDDVPLKGPC